MSTAALIGNGFSIAYNPELSVGSLTTALLREFEAAGDDLATIAGAVDPGSATGFEDLLGPFDSVSVSLGALPGLECGEPFGPRLARLEAAAGAARQLYREGTSITLDLIARRSHGGPDIQGAVDRLSVAIAELDQSEEITIGTLNYDGLLHSGFLRRRSTLGRPNGAISTKRPCGGLGSLRRDAFRRKRRLLSRRLPTSSLRVPRIPQF